MSGMSLYKDAGVDIEGGDLWVDVIKRIVSKMPSDPRAIGGIGGFSGLYRVDGDLLIAGCCDGVGTKLEVAKMVGEYRGLGQDLVAMNVNDLVTCGARPLFFLDYIACGRLDVSLMSAVVEGIADACSQSGCALLGGETAEMPGVYPADGFDLAGFAAGMVRESDVIDGSRVGKGDVLIGLASSGIHSNGFSLVRKVLFGDNSYDVSATIDPLDEPLGRALIRPTRLYVRQVLSLAGTGKIRGMAHITGGGLYGNIIRVIPKDLDVDIDYASWKRPAIFDVIAGTGVDEQEMRRVFNLGIGFCLVVAKEDAEEILHRCGALGEMATIIGTVTA